jgi:F-type H+-transporting ATPase subunit c
MDRKMNFRKTVMMLGTALLTLGASVAMAEEVTGGHADPYASLASALAISVAVLGGALAQGRTATAALEAIGRNPAARDKVFVPMIIGLALIESLVLYAFVIAFSKIKG